MSGTMTYKDWIEETEHYIEIYKKKQRPITYVLPSKGTKCCVCHWYIKEGEEVFHETFGNETDVYCSDSCFICGNFQ